jgi:hypothetical protein
LQVYKDTGKIDRVSASQIINKRSEDLQRAFAAGDAMVRLLEKAHESIKQKDPAEAREFEQVARQITRDYGQYKARYLESRTRFPL